VERGAPRRGCDRAVVDPDIGRTSEPVDEPRVGGWIRLDRKDASGRHRGEDVGCPLPSVRAEIDDEAVCEIDETRYQIEPGAACLR